MKKILSTLFAIIVIASMTVTCFAAYDAPVALGLFAGDTNNGWGAITTVSVAEPGEYSLKYEGEQRTLEWLIIKTATGNQEKEQTAVPAGTVISITELKIDDVTYTFDGGNATYDYVVGANQTIEIIPWLNPNFGGKDHIDNNPKVASKIEVTFVVNELVVEEPVEEPVEEEVVDEPVEEPADEPVEEEPAVEETPAVDTPAPEAPEEAPAEVTTSAEGNSSVLGIVLGVVAVVIVAVIAVVILKKKK